MPAIASNSRHLTANESTSIQPHCFLVSRKQADTEDDRSDDDSDASLHRLLRRFITTETLGTKPDVTPLVPPLDKKALEFSTASYRNENNVCTVGLPWIDPDVGLPNNKDSVLGALNRYERRFEKDPAAQYNSSIIAMTWKGKFPKAWMLVLKEYVI